ncbi:AGC/DMPK/ROCK protein kinase [Allomyces macrogynus ATCC 38327]|uniref:non-specific serine/threonine protein kinase n=1 Tax=Allomyces macrogynus (strain ATCC 38327) TaxID=578462 RepID=A0A0L0T0A4_ALLM3|nr:AGC/DMPK/ROCK protein kinase [Allomyces macrogynus ATCC 38327]|eukprot:KNE68218.1 AGC/DMPK/ROCK protein kinase [Allomyces macrogynus ATCC 38327]
MRVPTAVPAAAAGGTPPVVVSMEARQRSLHARALQRHASPAGDPPDLSVDALVDSVLAIYHDVKQTVGDNPNFAKFLKRFDPIVGQLNGLRISTDDFEVVQKLAAGAFGTVSLVRGRHDGKLYALKALKKKEVMKQENVFFMEERNVMAFIDSKWITRLYASFQDDQHLYLVMEYLPGGDLISLLDTRDDSTISEPEARFYLAELIVAVAELHQRHFAHRDLKPHNILIDKSGHIKLADFGSCIQVPADGKIKSSTSVGTPDYVSPEVLDAQNGRGNGYGIECDWWSVGIILYEVLCGDPPFLTDSLSATYAKIQKHKGDIKFPEEVDLSPEVKDLINRLLTPPETRLGRNGVAEIQAHRWFAGIDWARVEDLTPTFVPSLASDTDTRYFSPDEGDVPSGAEKSDAATLARGAAPQRVFMGHHLPFIGYTYLRPSGSSQQLNQVAGAAEATVASADEAAAAAGQVVALEAQLAAEKTKAAIVPKLEARIKDLDAQLAEEKSRGTSKSAGLEAQVKQLETQLADAKSRYDAQLADAKSRHGAQLADAVAAVQAKLDLATAAAEQDAQRAKANADKLAQDLAAARRAAQDTADDWSKRYDALNAAKVKADAAAVAAQDSAARRATKLDADLAEARANVARLTAQVAEAETVVKGLREAVAERDRNLARQKTEMTHKDEDLAKMRKEQMLIEIAARGKSEQAGVQATQLGQELTHVKEELKVERERKQKAEMALAEATLGMQQLAEQVEAAAAQIAALSATVAGKDAEIAAIKAQVDEAANELEVAKEQAAVKSAEVVQLTDRTAQLETDRRAAQDERDSVTHALAETEKALADLHIVHDRTQAQLADVRTKVDELTAAQQQSELACKTHLADLAAIGHAKHALEHDVAQLVADKATLEKNIDALNAKIVAAAEIAANEKRGGGFFGMKSGKRGEKMQQELVNAETRCAELEKELMKTRKQLADAMGQSVDEVMAIGSAHTGGGTSRATSTHSGLGTVGPHPTEAIVEDDRRNGRGFMGRRMTKLGKDKKLVSSKMPLESVGEGEAPPPLTSGFLKVYLKSGKSKLDWKRSDWAEKYVLVQGGKVIMADSKEHADDLAKNGTQLVDLTLDFVAIAGLDGIAELQKVKSKENLCVFKVQTMSRARPGTEPATGGGTSSASTLGKGASMPSMSSVSGAPASPTLPAGIGSDGSGGGMSIAALPPVDDTTALEAKLKDTHARIAVETTFIQVHQRMGGMHKAEGKVGVDKANVASKERLRILEIELQQILAQLQAQAQMQELQQCPQPVPLPLSIPQLADSPLTPDSPSASMPPPEMPARTLPGGPPPRDEPPVVSSSSSSGRRLGSATAGAAPRPQSICIGTSNAALVHDAVRRTRTSSEAADMAIPPTPSTPISQSPSTPFALSGSPTSTKVTIGGIDYDHVAGHYFKSDTLDMSTNCRSCYEFIEFNNKGRDLDKLRVKSCVMCDYHVHLGCFERARHDQFLLPCDAVRALKSTGATTVMFLAASAENKREWIKTFEWCRRQHLRALTKKQTSSYISADNMSATSHGFDVSHSGSEQHLASIRGSIGGSVRGSTAGV